MINEKIATYRVSKYSGPRLITEVGATVPPRPAKDTSNHDTKMRHELQAQQRNAEALQTLSEGKEALDHIIKQSKEKATPIQETHPNLLKSHVQKILIPVDASKYSFAAIQQGIYLAHDFNAELIVFHVTDNEHDQSFEIPNLMSKINWRHSPHNYEHEEGKPAAAILQYATEHQIDLIIMAKHDELTIEQESITCVVINSSPCPVWVIPFGS